MNYCMIVAIDKNNGIGQNQCIPWHIPEDLKYFAKLTKGNGKNAVLMGRKTYESIGKPLPKRLNIIITSNKEMYTNTDNTIFVNNNDLEIEKICEMFNIETLWIIGGATIYNMFIHKTKELYVTEINEDYMCDTFFVKNYQSYFTYCQTIQKENKIEYKKYFS